MGRALVGLANGVVGMSSDQGTLEDENWDKKSKFFQFCPGCGADDIVEQPEICVWCGFELRDAAKLQIRRNLMRELDRFMGMPTLMYDEIIDALAEKIIFTEKQLVKTCHCCGGQRIPEGIDHLHYEPENGLCLFELDGCQEAEVD